MRAHAVTGLGAVGDRESLDAIVRLVLNAPQAEIRQAAAIAVGRLLTIEDVEAVNALLHVIAKDRDSYQYLVESIRHDAVVTIRQWFHVAVIREMFSQHDGCKITQIQSG